MRLLPFLATILVFAFLQLPHPAAASDREAGRVEGVPAREIRVGSNGDAATISQAAVTARDGDTVLVEAGVYRGDTAVWLQKKLTIRAVGGRAVLLADGQHAEGKAIWVIRNGDFEIDGFDFVGARVPDGNGAGIRFERGQLLVRNSRFIDNQMGLLTGNDGKARLTIVGCEFSGPRDGDRWYHNLYVGHIDRLIVRNSVSHSARVGHLLKSRARENLILDNRLVDGEGSASYELEFPNGGIADVRGNRIEQSVGTENPVIVSYGAEGYRWQENLLTMNANTVVNHAERRAVFVRVARGTRVDIDFYGNRWLGEGIFDVPGMSRSGPLERQRPWR